VTTRSRQRPGTPSGTAAGGIGRRRSCTELDDEQLQQVGAGDALPTVIDTIGEIGGHFGANLGTCELAVALHSLLDSPRDKVLWDVGHQAYPHKLLTGRREELPTIRQYEGLAPFCSISSPSTTSWAPATPRPRSATRSG
jgi:1-deoxy-D-xylulose-5-phosphate synthase